MAEGTVGTWEVEELDLDPAELVAEVERSTSTGWVPMPCEHCGASLPELTPEGPTG